MINNRLTILATGLIGNSLMVWGFDYLLYPFVLYNFGLWKGGGIMVFLSFLVCLLTLYLYDYTKKDWLGIEAIKGLKEQTPKNYFQRVSKFFLAKSELLAFFFLALRFDAFITTIYLREGANEFSGMKKKDWAIFLSSLAVSNIYWLVIVEAGLDIFKYLQTLFAL
ncbi:MAG: hypothetical protein KBF51_04180 [Chitinophagales bacterium]|jgi:hypothetical protein|nr:hypothetical protein [Sphingobacteriaceae bacterium]MBP8915226.1 hypothetical protein [Chitinophagales bacterium]MBP9188711.1 hypothetical protein [Chitinophagales bacterium]